jgi:murein DD-endopeptidase MepM/ murein hydrolase activator NlpD
VKNQKWFPQLQQYMSAWWKTAWWKTILATLSSLVLVLVVTHPGLAQLNVANSERLVVQASSSDSIDSLRQRQQQIEQQRSNINQQQQQLQNLQRSAQNRLGGLRDNIQATAAQIKENEKQLNDANQRLTKLQADLAKAEKTYQNRQFSTVARLRFLQRQQQSQGWAVLLQSQNLNDFLDRRRQLKLVYESDRKILGDLKAESDELERQRRGVERQKNEIALITQQLQAQKSEYEAQAQTQQSLIDRLQADREALEAAEEQLAKDSDNLTFLIRQRIAAESGSGIILRGTGVMSLPVDAPVTSGFGYRVHPILGYRRFHAGIDFGASYGTVIRAADSGTVIFAGWYGGYGRAVIIDHGNNLTTLYGHTSEVYVTEGQAVQRGQPIAAVGATGLATGPHLHFEVRVNGEPVDPANYL